MRLRKEFGEFEEVFFPWGLAYQDWLRRKMICFPVPLNFLVAWARDLWVNLYHGPRANNRMDEKLRSSYRFGYEDGKVAAKQEAFFLGFRKGEEHALKRLEDMLEATSGARKKGALN